MNFIKWNPTSGPPPENDRKILLWYLYADHDGEKSIPGAVFGRYMERAEKYQPFGCVGNFNDDITAWAEVPEGPDRDEVNDFLTWMRRKGVWFVGMISLLPTRRHRLTVEDTQDLFQSFIIFRNKKAKRRNDNDT